MEEVQLSTSHILLHFGGSSNASGATAIAIDTCNPCGSAEAFAIKSHVGSRLNLHFMIPVSRMPTSSKHWKPGSLYLAEEASYCQREPGRHSWLFKLFIVQSAQQL